MMGSPADEPQRRDSEGPRTKITFAKPFAVGRHAVTRGQFSAFVDATGHKTEGGAVVWSGSKWEDEPKEYWSNPGIAQDDSHPVVCVNWNDAKAYADWLSRQTGQNYRLLTESEREYVARAGTVTPFWWGSAITPAQAHYNCNYTDAGGGSKGEWREATVPVGSFSANPWGLFNVHGNVWEWCADVWHDVLHGFPTDGSARSQGGDASRRVVRGGSWGNAPGSLRSASRGGSAPDNRSYIIGFRLGRGLAR
jgi:formylglycine-generating enzyme required for sulfatase activity